MSKHTAGPWKMSQDALDGSTIIVNADTGVCIAAITEWTAPAEAVDAWKADAKLIAAAPDMLEALIDCYTQLNPDGWQWLIDIVKEIIERATGQSIEEVVNGEN